MSQGVLPGLEMVLDDRIESATSPSRPLPPRPNAVAVAPSSPSLQGRQLTHRELVAELRAQLRENLSDAQLRQEIRHGLRAGTIRKLFVNESPLSNRAVVRYLRHAVTQPLFDADDTPSPSFPLMKRQP